MIGSVKRNILIFIVLATLALLVLGAALPNLDLKPGMPLPSLNNGQVAIVQAEDLPPISMSVNKFFEILFALLLTASLLFLAYKLIRGVAWREYWSLILKFAGYTAGAGFLLFLIFLVLSNKAASAPTMDLPPPPPEPPARTPLGPVPPVLLWIVAIILIIVVMVVGVWIYNAYSKKSDPINLLGLEAAKARQALLTGENIKDVILRCYLQMGLALKEEQGIERKEYMTPREFEKQLEALGMPYNPIHGLTQLFEAVRYGNWHPNSNDEQKAFGCLEAIIDYTREMKRE